MYRFWQKIEKQLSVHVPVFGSREYIPTGLRRPYIEESARRNHSRLHKAYSFSKGNPERGHTRGRKDSKEWAAGGFPWRGRWNGYFLLAEIRGQEAYIAFVCSKKSIGNGLGLLFSVVLPIKLSIPEQPYYTDASAYRWIECPRALRKRSKLKNGGPVHLLIC